MKNVIIFTKPKQPEVAEAARQIVEWFEARGIRAALDPKSVREADLCVVVGGDGTLLAAARLMGEHQSPILAINYGGLGFLTEVTMDEMWAALERAVSGDLIVDNRMMMRAAVKREGKDIVTYEALNDVVINKGTLARIIEIEARVDGHYVSSFRSDGLILATPTGSTAYNLSAGGPIVFPSMDAIVMTPICSHTLTNRPIVLPPAVHIDITLRATQGDVYVTVDGQVGLKLEPQDHLTVERSNRVVRLIAPWGKDYFDVLRGKLKWG